MEYITCYVVLLLSFESEYATLSRAGVLLLKDIYYKSAGFSARAEHGTYSNNLLVLSYHC